TDGAQAAVAGDDLERADPVGREAVATTERTHAAAEGVTDRTDVARRAEQRREAVWRCCFDDLCPLGTGADPGDAALDVDAHVGHPPGVDEQPGLDREA